MRTFNILMNPRIFLGSLLALYSRVNADISFPYIPTRLIGSANSSAVYVFQSGQLQLIDTSKSLSTTQAPQTLLDELPFLQDGEIQAYSPIAHADGNITVVTGNCSAGGNGTQIWQFQPNANSENKNGTWKQDQTSAQDLENELGLTGANYLASGVAFSTDGSGGDADAELYLFGGMCPTAGSTSDTWISAANYSNLMLSFSGEGAGEGTYNVSIATSSLRGPPVAEAGFSMTGLEPTFSADNSGQARTQQQDFLLIGGHTQVAFINMSQVALYSLPQQSWTYFPVDPPSGGKSGLATRQTVTSVEPRSGHTAVLSADGGSVIVLGGWVGDVTNPAQPQLAVLSLGSGYGGTSQDWAWSIPEQTGNGLPAGTGLYGHGATLLPGGVMLVFGGYTIPSTTSSRFRRATQTANQNMYLYNITSNTWITSYSVPSGSVSWSQDNKSSGPLSKTSQQTGLGVGLGVGVVLLVALIIFYFWYMRRLRRQREDHERGLLTHSSHSSNAPHDQPFMEKHEGANRGADAFAAARFDGRERVASANNGPLNTMVAAGSTGLFVDIPSPTRGLRKGPAGRPYSYHAAPRYDENRMSRGSAGIHPIVERAEEEESSAQDGYEPMSALENPKRRRRDSMQVSDGTIGELERALHASLPPSDPFRDPDPNPLGSHPVSPVAGETIRRVPTNASSHRANSPPRRPMAIDTEGNWTIPHGLDNRLERYNGRVSPTKTDDRTSSTLSERSQRSQASAGSITRTMSTRTGALLAAAFANRREREVGENSNSSSDERTSTMSSSGTSPFYWQSLPRSVTYDTSRPVVPRMAERSTDSFATARTSFAHLQSEGEALLGGRRPAADRDDPYQRALAAHGASVPGSHSANYHYDSAPAPIVPTRRRQGLLGSLRRALTGISMSDRSFSLTTTGPNEPYEDDPNTRSSSPIKNRKRGGPSSAGPRRAASDGGALLRQKRGQKDWDADKGWAPYRDDPDPGDWGEPPSPPDPARTGEEEWDVEGAANRRDFQVMFSVPKARLRVVNADMDRASLRSASDGAVSRSESLKALRREASLRMAQPRVRSDEHKAMPLASTAEEGEEGNGESSQARAVGKGKAKAV